MKLWYSIFLIKGEKGFSLAEVAVASALLGGLSLMVVHLSREQAVTQKRGETALAVNSIFHQISQTLLNGESCANTLGSGRLEDGLSITEIKNRKGMAQFKVSASDCEGSNSCIKYGNNLVKINSIELHQDSITGKPQGVALKAAADNRFGATYLRVNIERLSKLLKGSKVAIREIPLKIALNKDSATLERCYSATEDAVDEAKK